MSYHETGLGRFLRRFGARAATIYRNDREGAAWVATGIVVVVVCLAVLWVTPG